MLYYENHQPPYFGGDLVKLLGRENGPVMIVDTESLGGKAFGNGKVVNYGTAVRAGIAEDNGLAKGGDTKGGAKKASGLGDRIYENLGGDTRGSSLFPEGHRRGGGAGALFK